MASVVSTIAGGLETPDFLELRKNPSSRDRERERENDGPRSLYQVLPERQTNVRGIMGSERGYDVSNVAGAPIPVLGDERGTKVRSNFATDLLSADVMSSQRKAGGVDLSLDASEIEGLSPEELKRRYEAHARGSAGVPGAGNKEDFSDMVAKEMAKKKQKMDRDRDGRGKGGKEFKF